MASRLGAHCLESLPILSLWSRRCGLVKQSLLLRGTKYGALPLGRAYLYP